MDYRRSTAALDVRSTPGGAIHDPAQSGFGPLFLSDLRPLLHHRTTTITNTRIGTNSHAVSSDWNHPAHALNSRIALIVLPCAGRKNHGCLADSSLWQNSPGVAHWLLENLSRGNYVLVPVHADDWIRRIGHCGARLRWLNCGQSVRPVRSLLTRETWCCSARATLRSTGRVPSTRSAHSTLRPGIHRPH